MLRNGKFTFKVGQLVIGKDDQGIVNEMPGTVISQDLDHRGEAVYRVAFATGKFLLTEDQIQSDLTAENPDPGKPEIT